jgi:hypothetical protein
MARRTYRDFYKGSTPVATFVFPHLSAPSFKFAEFGEYQVSIDLTGKDATDLKKLIDSQFDLEYSAECAEKGVQLAKYSGHPYKPATDRDKNELPGVTRFSFKKKAGGRYGPNHFKAGQVWTSGIPIFAASGPEKVTEPIWGGTRGRVSFMIVPWFTNALGFGVRLQLEAVKVLELVSEGERAPAEYGFEDEEGYVPFPSVPTGADSELGESADTDTINF